VLLVEDLAGAQLAGELAATRQVAEREDPRAEVMRERDRRQSDGPEADDADVLARLQVASQQRRVALVEQVGRRGERQAVLVDAVGDAHQDLAGVADEVAAVRLQRQHQVARGDARYVVADGDHARQIAVADDAREGPVRAQRLEAVVGSELGARRDRRVERLAADLAAAEPFEHQQLVAQLDATRPGDVHHHRLDRGAHRHQSL